MKRINTILTAIAVSVAAMFSTSCVQDLNVTPIDPNIQTPDQVLNSIEAYQQLLAKCYGGLSVSASEGPDSSPDIGVPSSTCRNSLLMRPAPAGMTRPSSPSTD